MNELSITKGTSITKTIFEMEIRMRVTVKILQDLDSLTFSITYMLFIHVRNQKNNKENEKGEVNITSIICAIKATD